MLKEIVRVWQSGVQQRSADFIGYREAAAPTYQEFFHDIIECLIAALESKDSYTSGHSSRVADMSLDMAHALEIKGVNLENVHMAAHLHDIGKMGVSEYILNKPGKLLAHEWQQIQAHPVVGYNILSKSRLLFRIAKIVLYHHERWDGQGYPQGLQRHYIPLGSRVIAVADAVDAMTTDRPYRKPMSWEGCYQELQLNKEKQFDPIVVEAAAQLWRKWAANQQDKQT
ncbi:MAG: HD-GYP domain-containing protein [Dethiobacter sp.]|nr:HD-GYP domain-containing protein [Dethiobacter sp.]